jgi:hypothetical protein
MWFFKHGYQRPWTRTKRDFELKLHVQIQHQIGFYRRMGLYGRLHQPLCDRVSTQCRRPVLDHLFVAYGDRLALVKTLRSLGISVGEGREDL